MDIDELPDLHASFTEDLIADIIRTAFPNLSLKRNVRPEWLRSAKGKPLELDIVLPEMKLAIEIQGPQHYKQIFGNKKIHFDLKSNDLLKKKDAGKRGLD